jgi:AraC family transcriptional regulator
MIRYFNHGTLNLHKDPIPLNERRNWEFYAVIRGRCSPKFPNKTRFPAETRCLWVFPPNVIYGWGGATGPIERIVVHTAWVPRQLQERVAGSVPFLKVSLTDSHISQLESLVKGITPHYEKPSAISTLHFEKAVLELVIMVLGEYEATQSIPLSRIREERVNQAIAWYRANMVRNPTIEEVASAVHLSAGHLRRVFHDERGVSPSTIFLREKIRRATSLLSVSSETIDQIIPQCGFASASDFSRAFKRAMGVPPDVWRRSISNLRPRHEHDDLP